MRSKEGEISFFERPVAWFNQKEVNIRNIAEFNRQTWNIEWFPGKGK